MTTKQYYVKDKNGVTTDATIAHFGVKGMRWGVRRTQQQLGRAGSSVKSKTIFKDDKSIKDAIKSVALTNPGVRTGFVVKKKALEFIAGRQEKGARAMEKDAKSLRDAADELDRQIESGDIKGKTGRSLRALGKESKSFDRAIEEHEELAAAEADPVRAKKYQDSANQLREFKSGIDSVEANTRMSYTEKSKATSKMFRDSADAIESMSTEWKNLAAQNRKSAAETQKVIDSIDKRKNRGSVGQSEYLKRGDILHEDSAEIEYYEELNSILDEYINEEFDLTAFRLASVLNLPITTFSID